MFGGLQEMGSLYREVRLGISRALSGKRKWIFLCLTVFYAYTSFDGDQQEQFHSLNLQMIGYFVWGNYVLWKNEGKLMYLLPFKEKQVVWRWIKNILINQILISAGVIVIWNVGIHFYGISWTELFMNDLKFLLSFRISMIAIMLEIYFRNGKGLWDLGNSSDKQSRKRRAKYNILKTCLFLYNVALCLFSDIFIYDVPKQAWIYYMMAYVTAFLALFIELWEMFHEWSYCYENRRKSIWGGWGCSDENYGIKSK